MGKEGVLRDRHDRTGKTGKLLLAHVSADELALLFAAQDASVCVSHNLSNHFLIKGLYFFHSLGIRYFSNFHMFLLAYVKHMLVTKSLKVGLGQRAHALHLILHC